MQAMRFSSRYFNFCHLHRFVRCSILNANISRKFWKIANFRNQQFYYSFCTLRSDQSQQNDEAAAEKQSAKTDLAHIGQAGIEPIKNIETLRKEMLSCERNMTLHIKMNKSRHGYKWIELNKRINLGNFIQFAKIDVPNDAFLIVKAMNILLSKSVDDQKPPICHELVKGGLFYDYKLAISHYEKQFEFTIETVTTEIRPRHSPKFLFIPIQLLPTLRDIMAKMLNEFDGSQQIGPIPPHPKWTQNDTFGRKIIAENDKNKGKTIGFKQLKYTVDVEPRHRLFGIEMCREGINGTKYIQIVQKLLLNDLIKFKNKNSFYIHFPNIPAPEDANSILKAMFALENDLREKQANEMQQNQPSSMICHQIVKGAQFYDYKLEIHLREDKKLYFGMETITPADAMAWHKPRKLFGPIPIDVFHWLKDQMAEMLAEYEKLDVNEKENIEQYKTSSQNEN